MIYKKKGSALLVMASAMTLVSLGLLGSKTVVAHHTDSVFPTPNIYSGSATCRKGQLCKADSRTHTVYLGRLGPKMTAATRKTLNLSYHPETDLRVVYHNSRTVKYRGSWETDVIYVNRNSLPSNVLGRAVCDAPESNGKCDQFYVLYHADKIDAEIPNETNLHHALACHETGHTLGLTHGSNANPSQRNSSWRMGCMRTPLGNNRWLGTHNTHEINRTY